MQGNSSDGDQTEQFEVSGSLQDGITAKFKGRYVKTFVGFLVVAGIGGYLFKDNISKIALQWAGGNQIQVQKEKLEFLHPSVMSMADGWNSIDGIDTEDEEGKKMVVSILDKKESIFIPYERLEIDQLPIATQAVQRWHLARLKIIDADFSKDDTDYAVQSLNSSLSYLDQAEKFASDVGTMSAEHFKFIVSNHYHDRIKRTRLNALALLKVVSELDFSSKKKELSKLFDKFGGCDGLIQGGLKHKRILTALECPVTQQLAKSK